MGLGINTSRIQILDLTLTKCLTLGEVPSHTRCPFSYVENVDYNS
jgi:hypothetical protein